MYIGYSTYNTGDQECMRWEKIEFSILPGWMYWLISFLAEWVIIRLLFICPKIRFIPATRFKSFPGICRSVDGKEIFWGIIIIMADFYHLSWEPAAATVLCREKSLFLWTYPDASFQSMTRMSLLSMDGTRPHDVGIISAEISIKINCAKAFFVTNAFQCNQKNNRCEDVCWIRFSNNTCYTCNTCYTGYTCNTYNTCCTCYTCYTCNTCYTRYTCNTCYTCYTYNTYNTCYTCYTCYTCNTYNTCYTCYTCMLKLFKIVLMDFSFFLCFHALPTLHYQHYALPTLHYQHYITNATHYQHYITNTTTPRLHYQHYITNTTLPTLRITNTTLPTLHHQHYITNTTLPTLHYQHYITNTTLPTLHYQHYITNTTQVE